MRKQNSLFTLVATGCIIGGATGNVLDRVFRGSGFMSGAVVDFIDLRWWPVFNVADIGIVCGAIALAYNMITAKPETSEGSE
jgi:signal peptidase II